MPEQPIKQRLQGYQPRPQPQQPLSPEARDWLYSQRPEVQDDIRSQIRTRTQDPESYIRGLMRERGIGIGGGY